MTRNERLAALDLSVERMYTRFPGIRREKGVLMRVSRLFDRSMDVLLHAIISPQGITEGELHVLILLSSLDEGQATPGLLSYLVGKSPAQITRILGTLEKGGFIDREVDQQDARVSRVRLLASGREKVEQAFPAVSARLDAALGGLSTEEIATLDRLLRKAIASMDRSQPTT